MEVYILTELNILASGEVESFPQAFHTYEKAKAEMEQQVKERMDECAAEIQWQYEHGIKLIDEYQNVYRFEIICSTVE